MKYYAQGEYPKSIREFAKGTRHYADPSVAAKYNERNKEDPNIKPSVHDQIHNKFYRPTYMNPFNHRKESIKQNEQKRACANLTHQSAEKDVTVDAHQRSYIIYKPAAEKFKTALQSSSKQENEQAKNQHEQMFKLTIDKFRRSFQDIRQSIRQKHNAIDGKRASQNEVQIPTESVDSRKA
jgi:hypothetical protein